MAIRAGTREEWNTTVLAGARSPFTQSWEWGEFQEHVARPVLRLIARGGGHTLAAQLITMPLPRGFSYFYAPRAPLFTGEPSEELWREFRTELRRRARKGGQLFARIDPVQTLSVGFPVPATQPRHTSVVDLVQSEEALLAAMHQKTRYNIRLARKRGVRVYEQTNSEGLEEFLVLTRATAQRHDIRPEPESYYRAMVHVLGVEGEPDSRRCAVKLFFSEYRQKRIAASLAVFFGDTMTYAHGASSGEHKDTMAPYLLHWESMRYAKAHGFTRYDFRGVAPENAGARHPWAGLTRFKEGFGGKRESSPASFDLPYRFFLYPLYRIGALLKHKKV